MTTKKYIWVGVLAVAAIAIGIVAYYQTRSSANSSSGTPTADVVLAKDFTNPAYAFSFSYPDTYELTERTSTTGYSITLTSKKDLPLPTNGEAPPSITVNVYPNASGTALGTWLTANGTVSNYTLPNTASRATTIASGTPAVGYLWEGLYFGLSLAFEHNKNVIIFTGTYNNPTDQIVQDFEGVAATVKLQ